MRLDRLAPVASGASGITPDFHSAAKRNFAPWCSMMKSSSSGTFLAEAGGYALMGHVSEADTFHIQRDDGTLAAVVDTDDRRTALTLREVLDFADTRAGSRGLRSVVAPLGTWRAREIRAKPGNRAHEFGCAGGRL